MGLGLLHQEIMNMHALAEKIESKEISNEQASLILGVYNQTHKRVGSLIQIAALQSKEGKNGKTYSRFIAMNIISDGDAIVIKCAESTMIKCSSKGDLLMSREACLDYSGDARHIETCQHCEQFAKTRKQLCP